MNEDIDFQEVNIFNEPNAAKEIQEKVGEVLAPVFFQDGGVPREVEILKIKRVHYL